MNDLALTPELVKQLRAFSVARAPQEACGVLAGHGGHLLCAFEFPNYAVHPETEFWMNPHDLDYARARYTDVAVWHSHPTGHGHLSVLDKRLMVQIGLPMFVVAAKPFPSIVGYRFHGCEIVEAVRYDQEGKTIP